MSEFEGPWRIGMRVEGSGRILNADKIFDANDDAVCSVYGVPMHSSLDEFASDPKYADGVRMLHLIAAAPDLYAALELLSSPSMGESRPSRGESFIGWQKGDGPSAEERLKIARAALSRARGEPQ